MQNDKERTDATTVINNERIHNSSTSLLNTFSKIYIFTFVKSLASRPQVLENWPVLGSRTALFFKLLKFCGAIEKFFGKRFSVEIA